MRRRYLFPMALLLVLLMVATGCAPRSVKVRYISPAAVDIGIDREVGVFSIDQKSGEPVADLFYSALADEFSDNPYLRLADYRGNGLKLRKDFLSGRVLYGRGSRIQNYNDADGSDVVVSFYVDSADISEQRVTQTVTTGSGENATTEEREKLMQTATVRITTYLCADKHIPFKTDFDPVTTRMFEGTASHESDAKAPMNQAELMRRAIKQAAAEFEHTLSPRWVEQDLRFDGMKVEELEPVIKLLQEQKFAEAEAQLIEYVEANPDSKEATYNLALALDMQGRHEEAEELYLKVAKSVPNNGFKSAFAVDYGAALTAARSRIRARELFPEKYFEIKS